MSNVLLFEVCTLLGIVLCLSTPLAWSRDPRPGMGALSGAVGITLGLVLRSVSRSPARVAWLAGHEPLLWCVVAVWALCLLAGTVITVNSWVHRKVA